MGKMSEKGAALNEISVAILSCNRKDELKRTLTLLSRPDLAWKEIIVADNVSTDGTQAMVEQDFPDVHLIQLSENKGVYGINRAFEQASGKWILSLDDDSAPEVSTWQYLLNKLSAFEDAAAIGLSIVAESATENEASINLLKKINKNEISPAYGFSQAGCLFNKKALATLGGFDEQLFLWSVELHWTAKALTQGWALYSCSHAHVVHRSTPLNRSSRRHAFYYCRNLCLFILLYAPQSLLAEVLGNFINNALKYSALHSTFAYIQAIRQAQVILKNYPKSKRLSEDQFKLINPDLKAPFSYLG